MKWSLWELLHYSYMYSYLLLFPLLCVKTEPIERKVCFLCVYMFVHVLVQGIYNDCKPESYVCWRLVLVTCMSPGLVSLSAGRRRNQYISRLCWLLALPSSSKLVKYPPSQRRYFGSSPGLLSTCSIKSLSIGHCWLSSKLSTAEEHYLV